MGVVLFAMGGFGTYLGWSIRTDPRVSGQLALADQPTWFNLGKTTAELHSTLMAGMAFIFFLGANGGLVLSLVQASRMPARSPARSPAWLTSPARAGQAHHAVGALHVGAGGLRAARRAGGPHDPVQGPGRRRRPHRPRRPGQRHHGRLPLPRLPGPPARPLSLRRGRDCAVTAPGPGPADEARMKFCCAGETPPPPPAGKALAPPPNLAGGEGGPTDRPPGGGPTGCAACRVPLAATAVLCGVPLGLSAAGAGGPPRNG